MHLYQINNIYKNNKKSILLPYGHTDSFLKILLFSYSFKKNVTYHHVSLNTFIRFPLFAPASVYDMATDIIPLQQLATSVCWQWSHRYPHIYRIHKQCG